MTLVRDCGGTIGLKKKSIGHCKIVEDRGGTRGLIKFTKFKAMRRILRHTPPPRKLAFCPIVKEVPISVGSQVQFLRQSFRQNYPGSDEASFQSIKDEIDEKRSLEENRRYIESKTGLSLKTQCEQNAEMQEEKRLKKEADADYAQFLKSLKK